MVSEEVAYELLVAVAELTSGARHCELLKVNTLSRTAATVPSNALQAAAHDH